MELTAQIVALYMGQKFSVLGYSEMTLFSVNMFGKYELGFEKNVDTFNVRHVAEIQDIKPILRRH